MIRLLPIAIIALLTLLLSFLPVRRELAYRIGFTASDDIPCCNVANLSKTGNFDENAKVAQFNGKEIDYPKTSLAQLLNNRDTLAEKQDTDTQVLGTTTADGKEKWIDVSLDEQKLRAYEGDTVVMEFPISSGKWGATPKGTWNIWYKTRYQSMIGGSKELGTYYNLPNVPFNMFFNSGYAIHGAYWHNNFGQPMSHGCVNAPIAEVAKLFDWTGPVLAADINAVKASNENPGTKVVVH